MKKRKKSLRKAKGKPAPKALKAVRLAAASDGPKPAAPEIIGTGTGGTGTGSG